VHSPEVALVCQLVSMTALGRPSAIATDGRSLWVANAHSAHLSVLAASTGAFERTVTSSRVKLTRVTSMSIAGGRLWLASTSSKFVAGLSAANGALVRLYASRFSYPAVFGDPRHAWVVDRIQSRVSELSAGTGKILRVIVN
jgi:hypothetical protein